MTDGDAPRPEPERPSEQSSDDRRLSERERGELEELRHRIGALETAGDQRRHEPVHEPRHRLRSFGSALLIILASLLALLSVVAVWTNSIVRDTDRYVATVAPLASDPDVQQAVTRRVTDAVVQRIDVDGLVGELSDAAAERGVPPRAATLIGGLTGPISSGLKELVGSTVERVVSSPAFETIWTDANRRAHAAVDKALTGQAGGAVSLKNNQVAIDIGPIVQQVKERLVDDGFGLASRIPEVQTDFVVVEGDSVGKIKTYLRVLEILGTWLPVITVLVAAAGVFLAAHRRRALIGAALGVLVAMVVLGVALTVFRAIYLDHLPAGASEAAAGSIYDALVRFLRSGIRAVGALALVTALGAFFVGPSRPAVFTRHFFSKGIGAGRDVAMSSGLRLGAVGRFTHRYKPWIGAAILLVAAIVLFTWNYPTMAVVIWTAVIVLIALALREFLDPGPA
ncbi:hypothetical protein ACK389_34705 [Streptomyces antibioticus]|uniref:hypothetical protein n=1 Tax=Streptomyces antibioticus TaxID=1890 RepID=UPI00224ECDA4|nr:hypothetical protein [Streptomyces antibioticus]MCX5170737.1 hypothetical protein [Streptomyces antibioticus]